MLGNFSDSTTTKFRIHRMDSSHVDQKEKNFKALKVIARCSLYF